jgi:hypothetical protein
MVVKGETWNQNANVAAINTGKTIYPTIISSTQIWNRFNTYVSLVCTTCAIEKACDFSVEGRKFSTNNLQHLAQQAQSQILFMG